MDLHGNPHNESGRLEQIVNQFLLKSLHIILDSRTPLRSHDGRGSLPSISRARKSDKWFSLVLSDRPAALDNLNFWHRNSMDPMIIDIILVQKGHGSSFEDISSLGTSVETVIERWVVLYDSKPTRAPQIGDSSSPHKKTYKKSIILLRSLYAMMRLLPTYKIFRQLSSSSQTYNFDIVYKVSSFCNPFSRAEEEMMKEYNFVPVEALPGNLCISVMYRSTLSDFNLEPASSFPPQIITDYVGSPATDPMRAFTSTGKGACAISYPLRDVQPPSSPFRHPRPHSWTSGFHKEAPFAQNQTLGYSPPTNRVSPLAYDFPSPSPPDIYTHRPQNFRPPTYQKATSFDEYQLSPPFSSSPSPSPPTHHSYGSYGSPLQDRLRSETAPVTIPLPIIGRNSKYLSPCSSEPNRHSLPPLSPRGNRPDSSYQKSPSGIKSNRKTDALRAGELYNGAPNHQSGLKVVNDNKDDSGRFSGLLSSSGSTRVGFSRSSSRLSFQDDLDDFDISGPFDVDDVDTSDHSRKSQDAAVGALVHMLRTAPPLRQDRSFYSTHSLKNELEGEIGSVSEFFLPRKTSDALEELRSYKDMKDLLLSKSGAHVISKEEA